MLYYYAVREMSLEQILHLLVVIVEQIQAQNPASPYVLCPNDFG